MILNNTYAKNWMYILFAFFTISLFSCSKETIDNVGRDTALNIIRTGTWESWTVTIAGSATPSLNVTTQKLKDGEVFAFDKDGGWIKTTSGKDGPYNYSMSSPKVIVFDGTSYDIQENIVGTVSKLTLVNKNGAVTTTMVFKRTK